MKKICVIGLGYVGLPTAILLSSKKMIVNGYDINKTIVKNINKKKIKFNERDLNRLCQSDVVKKNFTAYNRIIESDVYVISVPTPLKKNKKADLSFVEKAFLDISKILKKGDLIILESTCPIGTTEKYLKKLKNKRKDLIFPSNTKDNFDVNLAYCPERVLPGNTLKELITNKRLIGGVTKKCANKAKIFYKNFVNGNCIITDAKIAEMAKLSENSYRDVNIAFANQLKIISDFHNINIWDVVKFSNLHPRVNIHKPGPGVGGHCIAIDPWFLLNDIEQNNNDIISNSRKFNDNIPNLVINNLKEKIKKLKFKYKNITISCFGLSYKANIDDLRESPSITIIKKLAKYDFKKILLVDPYVKNDIKFNIRKKVVRSNIKVALKESDIILFLVDHSVFKRINKKYLSNKIIIDTKGILQEL
jgi:UDP-N-acetyl-D-mannosaminuronic acid dehydrogenase